MADGRFLQDLRALLRICFPAWMSKEGALLLLVCGSMVARTLCDVWMIKNGTSIERAIVAGSIRHFARHIGYFAAAMVRRVAYGGTGVARCL